MSAVVRGLWQSSSSSKGSVSTKPSFEWDRAQQPPSPGSPSTSTSTFKDASSPHSLRRAQSNLSLGSNHLPAGGASDHFRPFMPSSLNPRPPSVADTLDSATSDATFNQAGHSSSSSSPTRPRQPPTQTPSRPGNSRSASSTPKVPARALFSSHSASSLKREDPSREDYGAGLNVGFRVRKKSSKLSLKSLASSAKQSIFSSHSTSGTQPSPPPDSPVRFSPHSPSFASRGPNAPPLTISSPTNKPFVPPSPTPHYAASGSLDLDRSANRGLGIDTPGFFSEEHGAGGVRGKAAKLLGESVVPSGKAARLLGMDQGVKPTKPHSPKTGKHKAVELRVETSRNQSAMGWYDLASDAGSPRPLPLSAPAAARAPSPRPSIHRPPSRTTSQSTTRTPSSAASSTYHPPSHSPPSRRESPPELFYGETARACRAASPVSSTFHSPPPSVRAGRHRSSTFGGLLPPFLGSAAGAGRAYSDPASGRSSPRDTVCSVESAVGRVGAQERVGGAGVPGVGAVGGRRGQRETWLSAAAGEINLGSIAMDEGKGVRRGSRTQGTEQGQGVSVLGIWLASPMEEDAAEASAKRSTSSFTRRTEVATSTAYSLGSRSSAGWSDRSTSYGIPSVFYPFAGIPASAVPHSPVSGQMPLSPASTHFRPDSPPPVPPINPALIADHPTSSPRAPPKPPATRSVSPPTSPTKLLASFAAPTPAPASAAPRSPFGALPPTRRPGRSNTVTSAVSTSSAGTKRYQRGHALDALEGRRRAIVQAGPMPKLGQGVGVGVGPALVPVPEGGVVRGAVGDGGVRGVGERKAQGKTAEEAEAERRKARESRPFFDWSDSEEEEERPARAGEWTPPQAKKAPVEEDMVLRVTPPRTSSKASRAHLGSPEAVRLPPSARPAMPLPPLPTAAPHTRSSPAIPAPAIQHSTDISPSASLDSTPAPRQLAAAPSPGPHPGSSPDLARHRHPSGTSTEPSTPGSPDDGRRHGGPRGRSDSLFSWLSSSSEEEWMDRFPEPPKFGEGETEVGGMIGRSSLQ